MNLLNRVSAVCIICVVVAGTKTAGAAAAGASEPSTRPASQPATQASRTTTEQAFHTFWWAIKNDRPDIAAASVDREKLSSGRHGRKLEDFIKQFGQLDPRGWRLIRSPNRISVDSPTHMMQYDFEEDEDGRWLIVGIHP